VRRRLQAMRGRMGPGCDRSLLPVQARASLRPNDA